MMELINPPSILKCRVCHHLCLGFPHNICGSLLASWLHKEANHNQLEPVPISIGVDSGMYWDPNTLCLPSSMDHPHYPSTGGEGGVPCLVEQPKVGPRPAARPPNQWFGAAAASRGPPEKGAKVEPSPQSPGLVNSIIITAAAAPSEVFLMEKWVWWSHGQATGPPHGVPAPPQPQNMLPISGSGALPAPLFPYPSDPAPPPLS